MLDGMTGKWKVKGERCEFYGQAVAEMTRDELLAVVGFLVQRIEANNATWDLALEAMEKALGEA